jgi:HNH endonuclease
VIGVRQRTCSFPGCRRPAARCDQDHTVPYDQGGRTCECNLAPLCRRHHRAKQAQGWRLDQPEPGVMVWALPHGRSYRVQPPAYPGDGAG